MSGEREAYRESGHMSDMGVVESKTAPRRVVHGKPVIQGRPVAQLKKNAWARTARAHAPKSTLKQALVLNRMLLLLMLPLLVMLLWSLSAINTQGNEYQEARSEYAALRELAGPGRTADPQVALPTPDEDAYEGADEDTGIDWEALRALNPDIVGWITAPATTIDYPIVQGRDNNWYLHHTFRGERNPAGAIFVDYLNAPDFSDGHMLVYGHNMQRGNMFAPLHRWNGDRFRIYTPEGVWEYEVFARQMVPRNSPLYSMFDSPRDDGAQVVTLSTCTFRRPAYRFVVQGVLIA